MEKYIQMLKNIDAKSAKIIETKSIVTAPWVVFKCQFGCSNYGDSWCCPPKAPSYRETQDIIDCYKTAILFLSSDVMAPTGMAVEVAREIFLDGYYKVIALGSGPCRKCKEFRGCIKHNCNFPEDTAPSMEACGIDVFQTARNNGYEINTVRSKDEIHNYFGLILVE